MRLDQLPISWVDFVTALVLLIGIVRGRKRGLSEELLDTLQWLAIVVAASFFYQQLADLIGVKPVLSRVTYSVISYIVIALVVKIFFTLIKKRIGQKLVESDIFGKFEFYAGMVSGSVRFFCMYFFVLSMLHAPYYSSEYRSAKAKSDAYNYGDINGATGIRFPTIMSLQDEVFLKSLTGKSAEKYLAVILMQPSSTDAKPLRGENSLAARRERAVDEAYHGK